MPELPTTPSAETAATQSYEEFLEDIKGRIRSAQARAARAISAELVGGVLADRSRDPATPSRRGGSPRSWWPEDRRAA
jgi:hypothetical protein